MRKRIVLLFFLLASATLQAQTLAGGSVGEPVAISGRTTLSEPLVFSENFASSASFALSKPKSPKIAGLCSIIPGGGQVYNGHYWKVPVVYAVLGASGGLTYYYHQQYIYYRTEYRKRLNGETSGLNPDLASMSDENVYAFESYYRRNQELGMFVFLLCYGLNIVEAMVDAHFSTFNISDDLTMRLQPGLQIGRDLSGREDLALGLSFVFQLK